MSSSKDDEQSFFIGWADTPPVDRRFFLRAGVGLTAAAGGLGYGLGALQQSPGAGYWDPEANREWRGIVTAEPYAMLRTNDLAAVPRTVLLSCLGKCGVAARIGTLAGQPVVVNGSLIQRGQNAMIAVDEAGDWIRLDDDATKLDEALRLPVLEPLGVLSLVGEILDSKCWFGAMRPASGKVHKACASLCIRGGIPPAFFVRGHHQQSALMIMSSGGLAYGPALLNMVGESVRLSGSVFRQGNLLLLDAPLANIQRV